MPDGPVDLLTWQSRRIRLHLTGHHVTAVLITNGDRAINKNQFNDPMTAYRHSKNQSSKSLTVHMPQEPDDELPLWRGLKPLSIRAGGGAPG